MALHLHPNAARYGWSTPRRLMDAHGIHNRKIRTTLASVCGITGSAVYQWFTTTKTIHPEHLLCIAKEFGTTVDWLLTGEDQTDIVLPPDATQVIRSAREQILALARSLETTNRQTSSKLQKIAMDLEMAMA